MAGALCRSFVGRGVSPRPVVFCNVHKIQKRALTTLRMPNGSGQGRRSSRRRWAAAGFGLGSLAVLGVSVWQYLLSAVDEDADKTEPPGALALWLRKRRTELQIYLSVRSLRGLKDEEQKDTTVSQLKLVAALNLLARFSAESAETRRMIVQRGGLDVIVELCSDPSNMLHKDSVISPLAARLCAALCQDAKVAHRLLQRGGVRLLVGMLAQHDADIPHIFEPEFLARHIKHLPGGDVTSIPTVTTGDTETVRRSRDGCLIPLLLKLEQLGTTPDASTRENIAYVRRAFNSWSDNDESSGTPIVDIEDMIDYMATLAAKQVPDHEVHYHSVRALATLADEPETRAQIIDNDGVVLLRYLMTWYADEYRVCTQAARAVANLAVCPEGVAHVLRAGFLPVLRAWAANADGIKLQSQALRALHNMRSVVLSDPDFFADPDTPSHRHQQPENLPLFTDDINPIYPGLIQCSPQWTLVRPKAGGLSMAGLRGWWDRVVRKRRVQEDEPAPTHDAADLTRRIATVSTAVTDSGRPSLSDLSCSCTHPRFGTDLDIVLVHGLRGSPFYTWRTNTEGKQNAVNGSITAGGFLANSMRDHPGSLFWPKAWLVEDLCTCHTHIRVLSVGFVSSRTLSNAADSIEPFEVRGQKLLHKLQAAHVGKEISRMAGNKGVSGIPVSNRPKKVVFVVHSMGGLLVKQVLALAKQEPEHAGLVKNTAGIAFYATPHFGSALATRALKVAGFGRLAREVEDLKSNTPLLLGLNEELRLQKHIKCLSFAEALSTPVAPGISVHVVPVSTAFPGVGGLVEVEADHITVCKPRNKEDPIYSKLRDFIRDV